MRRYAAAALLLGAIVSPTDPIAVVAVMRQVRAHPRLAALLDVDPGRISVKATTTERLGFTGRGEGIAAQAVATVLLPG